jgi:hypothetical protein
MSHTPAPSRADAPPLAATLADLVTARRRALSGPLVAMPADLAVGLFDIAIGLLEPSLVGADDGATAVPITEQGARSLSGLADIVHGHRRSVLASNAARLFSGSVTHAQ